MGSLKSPPGEASVSRVASAPCPICKRPSAPRGPKSAAPFCSARCRQVDLGKWLNEDYRVPVEETSLTTEEEP